MNNVQEIDTVLQFVRRTLRQFRIASDTVMTQQILLLGDSFYGYRFVALDFTAVWSANDQTLNVFDRAGQKLGIVSLAVDPEMENESITIPYLQRRAA